MSQLVMGMLYESAKKWGRRPVAVAASRRFEIERMLVPLSPAITSWGSTLYEYILGRDLAGLPLDLILLPDVKIALPWLADKLVEQEDWVAATIISDIIWRATKDRQTATALREQWDDLFENAMRFRRSMGIPLKSYWRERQQMPIEGAAWVYIPQPAFKAADRVFFSRDGISIFEAGFFEDYAIDHILKQETYFVMLKGYRPDLEERLIGRIIGADNRQQWVYSTHGTPRAFVESSPLFAGPPLLNRTDLITADLEIRELSPEDLSNLQIAVGGTPIYASDRFQAWALLHGGSIVGAWSTSNPPRMPTLLSFYVVAAPHAVYSDLRGLIERASLSIEARLIYERTYMRRIVDIYRETKLHPVGEADLITHFGEWYAEQRKNREL